MKVCSCAWRENLEIEDPKKDVVKQLFATAFKHTMPPYIGANSANSIREFRKKLLKNL